MISFDKSVEEMTPAELWIARSRVINAALKLCPGLFELQPAERAALPQTPGPFLSLGWVFSLSTVDVGTTDVITQTLRSAGTSDSDAVVICKQAMGIWQQANDAQA